MQKSTFKRNLIIFVVTMLLACAACLFLLLPDNAVIAEGNNAGSSYSDDLVSITVDVNGVSVSSAGSINYDDTAAKIASNNGGHYRERYIQTGAIIESIAAGSTASNNVDSNAVYEFVKDSIINGSNCFTAAIDASGMLVVNAVQLTEAGYFSVQLKNTSSQSSLYNTVVTANIKVTVQDTFYQAYVYNKNSIYIGYDIKSDDPAKESVMEGLNEVEASSLVDGVHVAIETLNEKYKESSIVTIDLGEIMIGKALYADETQIFDNNAFWSVKSVKNFTIKSAMFEKAGMANVLTDVIIANPTSSVRINPTIKCKINIDSYTVGMYHSRYGTDFFADTHYLALTIGEVSNAAVSYTVYYPVNFIAQTPQSKSITVDSNVWRLNVISGYTRILNNSTDDNTPNSTYKDFETDETVTPDDINNYRAIVVSPDDLVDYAAPAESDKMYFDPHGTKINGSTALTSQSGCRIQIYGDDSDSYSPEQYIIIADKGNSATSSFTINFEIAYGNNETISVEIVVEVYGGYTIKFDQINGKKSVSYNFLTSRVFSELRADGYMLKSVTSTDDSILYASYANNVVTLDPQVENIDGRASAPIELVFVDQNNQTISIVSEPVSINVNAGSLFARFDDWEAWLIIAACIIGGLLIILLIVWLFIHSISKHRQAELATQAPVSSYIVKLNSTIAATQAQQRMAQTQALTQASTMLLGAGPTGTAAPPPDTLQLASGGVPYTNSTPAMPSTPSTPLMSEPQATIPPDNGEDLNALIAKYITDEELLERIYTEKYEPKGMVRRTFFKSKDLQARELEKEKKRIIDRYKSPMPMDEAVMSENDAKKEAQASTPSDASVPQATESLITEDMFVLDFDPDEPLYVEEEKPHDEFSEEKIDLDASPEEAHLNETVRRNEILIKELTVLKSRITKVQTEIDKAKSLEDELREKINKAEADDEQYGKDIEELEFSLASAKKGDKDRITRDIGIKEEKKQRNLAELERLRKDLDALLGNYENLNAIATKLSDTENQKNAELEGITSEREKAQSEYDAYMERLAQVQARQELEAKVNSLSPMLVEVNASDYELRKLQEEVEKQDKEREALKGTVAVAKTQIMGATDFDVINDLNTQISEANARLSELEKETTKLTKRKSELNIDFNAQRRKANDFIEKNDIPLEDVVEAENIVLGNMEFDIVKAQRENDKIEAEKAVADAQAVYDDLNAASDELTFIAMEVAANIKGIEEEVEAAQAELDAINQQMENASEDERLLLIVDQGDKADKLEELKAKLEQENIEGTKRKMEAQSEHDEKLEEARNVLAEANETFEKACASYDDLINNTNPLDLIMSGSGIISQDQKKREAENLKKQLERSKNEIEQARLAAQMAQMEAEQARVDAARASEEARAEAERAAMEAERSAQEAIERAEQARIEAEEKARADAEEAERARKEAEEALAAAAEEAQRKAQEEAEKAKLEAEEAQRKAQEEAEEAQRKAQEEAEEAKRIAQEESEEAQRKALEEAEEAKRIAQEESEEAQRKAQEESEEAQRKAQEEAEKAKLEAEEAQRKAQEEAEEAQRKAQEEAEEAKRIAQEEAEEAKRKAMEEAEEAQRKAMEEVEEAKRKAQEEIEEMRRKSEEEAEAKRLEEENKRKEEEERQKAEEERNANIAKKIAMRKEQIVAIRNEMKELKGDEDAKNLRERLYNIQLTYDEDERGSSELMDFYNKTMDDIQSAGEIARLKAENAKKPQRVVRKVTERVNRIAKRRPQSRNGARPASRAGARPASRAGSKSARPASRTASKSGARPASRTGARPAARPGARPSGSRPTRK